MEVNVHDAKTNLSRLIAAAESGEDVVIARNGKPAVRLVRVTSDQKRSRKAMLGAGIGKLWMSPDAFSPEAELETESLFEVDDPLFEPEHRPTGNRKKPA